MGAFPDKADLPVELQSMDFCFDTLAQLSISHQKKDRVSFQRYLYKNIQQKTVIFLWRKSCHIANYKLMVRNMQFGTNIFSGFFTEAVCLCGNGIGKQLI